MAMLTWQAEARAATRAAEDEREDDLLGRVGRRADGVRAEDRERLRLRQPLAELLVLVRAAARATIARTRATQPAAPAWSGRWRPPWPSACPGRCSGSRARAAARRGRAGRPACGPAAAADRRSSGGPDADASRSTRRPRQADGAHRRLDGRDVVGDAVPVHAPGVGVEDEVAGARDRRRAAGRRCPGLSSARRPVEREARTVVGRTRRPRSGRPSTRTRPGRGYGRAARGPSSRRREGSPRGDRGRGHVLAQSGRAGCRGRA